MAVKVSGTTVIDGSRNIINVGNVDGRDVSVDGAKLDGIEAGATADQTPSEIKTAYESNADTNAYTDAEKSKLAGIATGAEVNQNAFSSISVAGQSDVVADTKTDAVTFVAGTGVSITTNASTDAVTFTNSAPDQVVSLTGSGATSVSGTYPNFTISSTDNNTTYTAGSGLTLTGTSFSANIGTDILAYDANLQSFVNAFTLPTADGSTGQVLTTNGAGTLSFTTITGYTNADVDAHLNTSTATTGQLLSWTGSDYDWITVSSGATDINGLSDAQSFGATSYGLGFKALSTNNTGTNNLAFGREVLKGGSFNSTVSGSYNFASGMYSGESISTGTGNILLGGFGVGQNVTSGAYNVFAGHGAGNDVTTGSNNVAIGNGALDAATTGGRNIAIGQDAMGLGVATAASGDNVAIGYQAGYDLTSGVDNILIGEAAGSNFATASNNISIGGSSCLNWTGGSSNTVIGHQAGFLGANSTGERNTLLGAAAGLDLANGSDNVFLGHASGVNVTSGSQNIHIGRLAGDTTTTGSNQVVIGHEAEASSATVSNEITLGDANITRFRIPGAGIDNTSAALSGTTPSVDVGARDTYTLTTSGNTTFTFTGAPSSGQVGTFSLIITAGGTHTLTWPASVDWAGGTAPDAPASGEKDIYTFMTVDGGTTWYGFLAGDAMA